MGIFYSFGTEKKQDETGCILFFEICTTGEG